MKLNKFWLDIFANYKNRTSVVDFDGSEYSYYDLQRHAFSLANHLKKIGANKEYIAYYGPTSFNSIKAFLGIVLSGNYYLPIHVGDPEDRVNFILNDSNCRYIISSKNGRENSKTNVISPYFYKSNNNFIDEDIPLEGIVYLIYTSGTTGQPKGCIIHAEAMLNMISGQLKAFNMTSADRVLQISAVSFDASISEMMMAFCSGGTLVYTNKKSLLNSREFANVVNKNGITIFTAVPSFISKIDIESLKTLRALILAGEDSPVSLVKKLNTVVEVFNAYGPSECAVCTSVYKFSENIDEVYIGYPLENISVGVLLNNGGFSRVGRGELLIGGKSLGLGYHNRVAKTEERFKFIKGQKYYLSGDEVEILQNGLIKFIGRVDNQVKISGYRIELENVSQQALTIDMVTNAVCIIEEDTRKKLVLIVESTSKNEILEIVMDHLKSTLPPYMIPNRIVKTGQFKLKNSGKIDVKKTLSSINENKKESVKFDRFSAQIANIWKSVLGIDSLSFSSNYFAIGGDSLSVLSVVDLLYRKIGIDISANALYENPVFEKFVDYVRSVVNNAKDLDEDLFFLYSSDIVRHQQNFLKVGKINIDKKGSDILFIIGGTSLISIFFLEYILQKKSIFERIIIFGRKGGYDSLKDRIDNERLGYSFSSDFGNFDYYEWNESFFKEILKQEAKNNNIYVLYCVANMNQFTSYSGSRSVNVEMALENLLVLHKVNAKVIYLSSVAVFGFDGGNFHVKTNLNSVVPDLKHGYSSSKLASEIVLQNTRKNKSFYGNDIKVVRLGAIYSSKFDLSNKQQWLQSYFKISFDIGYLIDYCSNLMIPCRDIETIVSNLYGIFINFDREERVIHEFNSKLLSINEIFYLTKFYSEQQIFTCVESDWKARALQNGVKLSVCDSILNVLDELKKPSNLPTYS